MRNAVRASVALSALLAPAAAVAQDFPPSEPITETSDTWQDPDIDENYPRRGHVSLKAAANAGVRALYGSLIGLAGIELAAGFDTKGGSFYGAFGGAGGRTESGLSYGQFTVGPDLEWSIDIVRLGIQSRIGYIAIGRVTESGPFELFNWSVGAMAGVDVYRADGVAFALGVQPRVEWARSVGLFDPTDDAFIGGASAFFQVRYRIAKQGPKVDGGSF